MKKNIFKVLIAISLSSVIFLNGCSEEKVVTQQTKVTRIQGKTMGTFYGVIVPGGYEKGDAELKKLCEDTFNDISKVISTFDPKAELALFNEHKSTEPYPI